MKKTLFLLISGLLIVNYSVAQKHLDFKITDQVKASSVKNQYITGTCWSYATTSFIETEAIRKGKKEIDLSEMYFVFYAYIDKANDYTRFHGNANFSEGGQAHDVSNVVKRFGLVPEEAYSGITYHPTVHNHIEMVKNLTSILENATKNQEKLSQTWFIAFQGLLESYLGLVPETFTYEEKKYTPKSFNEQFIDFNPEDYIEFTSYTHHPFYEFIDLELPDNWSHDKYFNLPIDELIQIMNNALKNGYSIDWDGDVSEEGFNHKSGKSTLSDKENKEIAEIGYQKFRQKTFDDYSTTDDHLMHITGIAKDKNGNIFYLTKNSWGVYNNFGGYLYMSEDYVKIKTIAFMVHKDAVPSGIANKIGIKR